ncbi:GNAT family N-acetyltransferase [Luteibacter anthropi]|nr:GNAT family N-acetyltransferase [Luteibacter anthropi]
MRPDRMASGIEIPCGMDTPQPTKSVAAHIRAATDADASAIALLMRQLGYEASEDLIADKLSLFSHSDSDIVFLATIDQRVAGCLSAHVLELFHAAGRLGRITSLVVDADARGTGIGQALVDRAMLFFSQQRCVRVEVTSGDHRLNAHAFYKAVGFVEDERRFIRHL